MDPLSILIFVALLLLCAFFAGAELAIMTLPRMAVETAARKGEKLARMQLKLREKPQRFLGTILICYNVANVALTFFAAKVTDSAAEASGVDAHLALVGSGLIVTIALIIFGELIPKSFAALNAQRFAAFATLPLYYLSFLLTPVNIAIDLIANPIVRLLTGGRAQHEQVMSREEMATALMLARASGRLHEMDAEVAAEALEFSQKDLRDVMTPRVDVAAVPDTATAGEALEQMSERGFTRLPVYHGDMDEVRGVLLAKDLIRDSTRAAGAGGRAYSEWTKTPVEGLLRRVLQLPATKSIVEALDELRADRSHLAVVVDEHGGTAGIVTLEDILEELVGDIQDEYETEQEIDIVRRGPGFIIASGRARPDLLEVLAVDEAGSPLPEFSLPQVDATSLGGLLMERLGRAVKVGDSLDLGPLRITALKVVRNRIKLLRIELLSGAGDAD